MKFAIDGAVLTGRKGAETLRIEPWGRNALRVRSTVRPKLTGLCRALTESVSHDGTAGLLPDGGAFCENGRIRAEVTPAGIITYFRDGKQVLQEYYSNYDGSVRREAICYKQVSREFKGLSSDAFRLTVRFEAQDGERFYGMGQYQHHYLNLKGCTLELAQRNSQVSVPFLVSGLGYGLLWNNPAVGEASFAKNMTRFVAEETQEMDYWITADETPRQLVENYTACTGRAPVMPEEYLGLWQCRLRYRTPKEVLEVARHYRDLGIRLSVIVIDFFHWPYQGSWRFDEKYWPEEETRAMCRELHEMGTKVMVSVWPSVDKRSENYAYMSENAMLLRAEKGTDETYDYQGECGTADFFNPETRAFVYRQCREHYESLGIDLFWLDNSEPDMATYDFDNVRNYEGRHAQNGCEYPKMYLRAFAEPMGQEKVYLIRSAWAGSQKYGALVWTGDIQSNWETFRDQVVAGQNMGLAGIPWWTTDIGGFMTKDNRTPEFRELLVRWYEWAAFGPVLRMHGDRSPIIPALDDRDFGGGYLHAGQPNELWSYGEEAYAVMKKYLDVRLSMKAYIAGLMREAHETGAPLIRPMFFEFPEDERCWDLPEQYMFGPEYLVAPVLQPGCKSRSVYLPEGEWEDVHTGETLRGGRWTEKETPLDVIPLYRRR